ncbi:PIN2/TERF1-interacting telomerase inhibitor 1 [Pieris rapae]|uniref:PIN2/TERF1-interacting telomerase inhibitor 1 n=1 Tax=Pieris rapae TaxID=64459 RepID=UPI000B92BD9E|nr:PIN2/TERF1-interacting telomerase inhibitor 1 [Pieris rapae]
MSMLAEPRRKQKIINLRAKNNAWSNDTNKFGQRMLEKMGWSAGKGLGAKENGIVEHVIAKYKNDDKGLGYEDKNDQWTKHEDDFNALLANLSNDKDETKEVLHSGVSLETKSKKSKARIHYHKFTRGKDLSRYSEKDLANIFGKKSFKEETIQDISKEELESTEKVFTEKGSMEDYFKSKMSALKSKKILSDVNCDVSTDCPDFVFQGFSSTKEDGASVIEEKESLFYNNSDKNNEHVHDDTKERSTKKKKKTKSKKEISSQDNIEREDFVPQGSNDRPDKIFPSCDSPNELEGTVLFKKKNKRKVCDNEVQSAVDKTENGDNKKRSKKKDKKAGLLEVSEQILTESSVKDNPVTKKKKKKNKEL